MQLKNSEEYETELRDSMRTQSESNAMIVSMFKRLKDKNAHTKQPKN